MPALSPSLIEPLTVLSSPDLGEDSADRRRHERFPLTLTGRYMLPDGAEYLCESSDVAVGGLAIKGPRPGRVGERVICYLDGIGRLDGVVVRRTRDWFALEVRATSRKLERLGERLEWLLAGGQAPKPNAAGEDEWVMLIHEGESHPAKLVDVSIHGATLAADIFPPVGSTVLVGQISAVVTRHFPGGLSVDFAAQVGSAPV